MKKLFLFVSLIAVTVSLNSCSSDSDGGSSMSLKVDGVKKNFKTVIFSFGGTTSVYGYTGNVDTPTEEVEFDLATGTGAGKVTNFNYYTATTDYTAVTFTSNVTENSATSAKGTFSGTVEPFGAGADVVITEGTFSGKVTVGQ
ncbi:hypothetical protein [Flavobacterium sp.]|uniref:hypothetical protein n=1 Tax=Flavobacterium sp. TaxID=239 RepID=UPI00248733A8|nr:hypothetical protein [Flavobacterium sp.]MDI1316340.1 hypothetical protein [Flavobacterium sp.]